MSADLVQAAVPEFEAALAKNELELSPSKRVMGVAPGASVAPMALPAWILTLAWPIIAKVIADVAIPYFETKFPAAKDALEAIAAWLRSGATTLPG